MIHKSWLKQLKVVPRTFSFKFTAKTHNICLGFCTYKPNERKLKPYNLRLILNVHSLFWNSACHQANTFVNHPSICDLALNIVPVSFQSMLFVVCETKQYNSIIWPPFAWLHGLKNLKNNQITFMNENIL